MLNYYSFIRSLCLFLLIVGIFSCDKPDKLITLIANQQLVKAALQSENPNIVAQAEQLQDILNKASSEKHYIAFTTEMPENGLGELNFDGEEFAFLEPYIAGSDSSIIPPCKRCVSICCIPMPIHPMNHHNHSITILNIDQIPFSISFSDGQGNTVPINIRPISVIDENGYTSIAINYEEVFKKELNNEKASTLQAILEKYRFLKVNNDLLGILYVDPKSIKNLSY